MKHKSIIMLVVLFAVFSCTKNQEKTRLNSVPYRSPGQTGQSEISSTELANAAYEADPFTFFLESLEADSKEFKLPDISRSYKGNVKQNFPTKYLLDSLVFKDIPLQSPYPSKKIALVGYDKAKLYSDSFQSGKKGELALSGLQPLKNIPIGTILPILAEYRDDATEENQSTGFLQL